MSQSKNTINRRLFQWELLILLGFYETMGYIHPLEYIISKISFENKFLHPLFTLLSGIVAISVVEYIVYTAFGRKDLIHYDYSIFQGLIFGLGLILMIYLWNSLKANYNTICKYITYDFNLIKLSLSIIFAPFSFLLLASIFIIFRNSIPLVGIWLNNDLYSEQLTTGIASIGWQILNASIAQTAIGYFLLVSSLLKPRIVEVTERSSRDFSKSMNDLLRNGLHFVFICIFVFFAHSVYLFVIPDGYDISNISFFATLTNIIIPIVSILSFLVAIVILSIMMKSRIYFITSSPLQPTRDYLTLEFESQANNYERIAVGGYVVEGDPAHTIKNEYVDIPPCEYANSYSCDKRKCDRKHKNTLSLLESMYRRFCEYMTQASFYSYARSADQAEKAKYDELIGNVEKGDLYNHILDLGKDMFQTYIKPNVDVHHYFRRAFEEAEVPLIRLYTDENNAKVPWELICFGTEGVLCLNSKTVRVSSLIPKSSERFILTNDILVIGANPHNKHKKSGFGYWGNLPKVKEECKKIKDIFKSSDVNVKVLIGDQGENAATKKNVIREVEKGTYQIFHFAGHSKFDYEDPKFSKLILEGTELEASELLKIFEGMDKNNRPELIFMDSCESAIDISDLSDLDDNQIKGVHGLAHALHQAGIPYIVGMQWTISDTGAISLSKEFYKQIVHGQSVPEALRLARVESFKHNDKDPIWACPILYGSKC